MINHSALSLTALEPQTNLVLPFRLTSAPYCSTLQCACDTEGAIRFLSLTWPVVDMNGADRFPKSTGLRLASNPQATLG